ncbi:MAG: hypothetical protein IPM39_14985 [Chloroflexi bacterium]|nr:hypothetical protein [Chloroflexota bacterium]
MKVFHPLEPNSESNPEQILRHLKERVSQEREKEEHKLFFLGKYESDIDFLEKSYSFASQNGIFLDADHWPGILYRQFDRDFPPGDDSVEAARGNLLLSSTAGSTVYGMISDNISRYEMPETIEEAQGLINMYEDLRQRDDRNEEIIRRLGWLNEEAAGKYKAAWEGLDSQIPSTDPLSGAAISMRSALDLTIRDTLIGRLSLSTPVTKAQCLVVIADHIAKNASAKELLIQQAPDYLDITNKLSRVKGTSDTDIDYLKSQFYRSQQLLYLLLETIDINSLPPK